MFNIYVAFISNALSTSQMLWLVNFLIIFFSYYIIFRVESIVKADEDYIEFKVFYKVKGIFSLIFLLFLFFVLIYIQEQLPCGLNNKGLCVISNVLSKQIFFEFLFLGFVGQFFKVYQYLCFKQLKEREDSENNTKE